MINPIGVQMDRPKLAYLSIVLVLVQVLNCGTVQGMKITRRSSRSSSNLILTFPIRHFKQGFVDIHNTLRREVQPEASNMKLMSWSKDLANIASMKTSKCEFEESEEPISSMRFNVVGENLYEGYVYPGRIPEAATKAWFKENEYYNYTTSTCAPGHMCGHYTQVVWADSFKLGCSISYCRDLLEVTNGFLVACVYGPVGNTEYKSENGTLQFVRPYLQGQSGSRCRKDRVNDGLCIG